MRQFNQVVFDEVISAELPDTTVYYFTSDAVSYLLGQYDQLAIQAIADNLVGGGGGMTTTIEIAIQSSCDARNWVQKNPFLEILASPISTTGVTLLPWGKDDGSTPSYAFVRFRIGLRMRSYAGSVHLKIHVTGRDQGGVTVIAAANSLYHPVVWPSTPRSPSHRPGPVP